MFLSLVAHYVVNDYVTCNAGFEEDKELRSLLPKSLIQLADNEEDTVNDPQPFRVCFDMTSIDDYTADSGQCSASQYTENCQASTDGDYLTDEKRAAIKETFANVNAFLEENINVSRLKTGVKLNKHYIGNLRVTYKNETDEAEGRMSDCDIFIPVLARPFGAGSSGLAYASSNTYASGSERPVQGSITVNPAKIPSKAQNFESGQRQFLSTVLHEINHVLSFSGSLFDRWKDSDGNKYNPVKWEPVSKEADPYRIQHVYIKTPHLLEWVNNRFHVEDEELKTYGLELEDGGSTGTAFSHPNERLFFTDLMQGRIYGPGYISGMFYNTLWDTGWYKVSENVTEDMAYLDDSIFPSTCINQSIINQPPILTYPPEYLCKDSSTPTCFYDSIYVGICSLI